MTGHDSPSPTSGLLRGIGREFGELVDELTAADLLGIKVRTLQEWRSRGLGPPFVKLGSHRNALVRYPLAQLKEFLDRHLVPPLDSGGPHSDTASAGSAPAGQPKNAEEAPSPTRRPRT